jgi:hypothetical protein
MKKTATEMKGMRQPNESDLQNVRLKASPGKVNNEQIQGSSRAKHRSARSARPPFSLCTTTCMYHNLRKNNEIPNYHHPLTLPPPPHLLNQGTQGPIHPTPFAYHCPSPQLGCAALPGHESGGGFHGFSEGVTPELESESEAPVWASGWG